MTRSNINVEKNHPIHQIISSVNKGVMIRNKVNEELCLISQFEPRNVDEAFKDDFLMKDMKEELVYIGKTKTWELVPRPKDTNLIGTKWVFINKMNDQDEIVRNKARVVCKGCSQQEGINFDETCAPLII